MRKPFSIALILWTVTFTVAAQQNQSFTRQLVSGENIYRIQNPDHGARLSYVPESGIKILEVSEGGYTLAFKDLNKNGKLDKFEDWRLSAEERAEDLAGKLTIEQIAGLMLYPVGEPGDKGVITDAVRELLEVKHVRFMLSNRSTKDQVVNWNNAIQKWLETNDPNGIPANVSSDPRNTIMGGRTTVYDDSNMSGWPGNLGLAAAFDPEYVLKHGQVTSQEYRAFGISTALSPQVDLASEPRWSRYNGTFGEGSKLAADLAVAYVKGFQSTWDGLGNQATDLGWGKSSVVTMIKHFPGDGAAEGGREAHNNFGKYNVYPGNNLAEHYSIFKATVNIDCKSGGIVSVMPSYSIAMGNHGPIGQEVASGYSEYKLKGILRDSLGFKGVICADWNITSMTIWGVEKLTTLERHWLAIRNGLDMFGGSSAMEANRDAYAFGKMALQRYVSFRRPMGGEGMPLPGGMMPPGMGEDKEKATPEEQLQAIYRGSAARILKTTFLVGLFEDPYLVGSETASVLSNRTFKEAAYAAQKASVVLLKNKGNIIQKAGKKKKTAYVPMRYYQAVRGFFGPSTPASIGLDFNNSKSLYENFNIVTDAIREGADKDNPKESDIIRRTDFKGVDFVMVSAGSPSTGTGYDASRVDMDPADGSIDNGYYPVSLQYRKYVADPAMVRPYPMAVDPEEELKWIAAGGEPGRSRYYGGKSVSASNENELDYILDTRKRTGTIPVVLFLNVDRPMIFSEFESKVDAILVGFAINNAAAIEAIAGKFEPSGLLPMQMPANMETVEKQFEDVPLDMKCHIDSEGHSYNYAYGLNWSGVIRDWRTEKYGAPLTRVRQ